MSVDAKHVAAAAGRAVGELTRRDVAGAMLGVRAADALRELPDLRRQLLAAGNPLSARFWESAESLLERIDAGTATVGNVDEWLEATGTEPTTMIGLVVWADESERSPLHDEMHGRLVRFLEDQLAAGQIDPDLLLSGDAAAWKAYAELQEQWLTSPLPDGRVPMDVVLDEVEDGFLAEWDAADAAAAAALRRILGEVGDRPVPHDELTAACTRVRAALAGRGRWGEQLASCGGIDRRNPPDDDVELWLTLATGVVNPMGEPSDEDDTDLLAAVGALDHVDWLGAMAAIARGGPGISASPASLVQLINECEDVDGQYDPDDEEAIEHLFDYVVELWRILGAVDESELLTALGWWGLPEAMQRAWAPEDRE